MKVDAFNATGETKMPTLAPTRAQYTAFAALFQTFNERLFEGQLPEALLVFSRRKMVHGHFIAGAWRGGGAEVDEISLNPDRFSDTEPADFASTLLHEMCHQFQAHHGEVPRRGYHDWQFANIMEERGLQTTADGTSSGKRTGQRMDHLIIPDGPFAKVFGELDPETFLPFRCTTIDRDMTRRPNALKTKYSSPGGRNVWGAPGLELLDLATGEVLAEAKDGAVAPRPWRSALLSLVRQLDEDEAEDAVALLQGAGLGR